MSPPHADVAIVGGGPVGLYVALALLQRGLAPRVYERSAVAREGSRSIGVHPPSIELFDELGLGETFLSRARLVRRGTAFGEHGSVGTVSFERCPPPHRFVATLEQCKTEHILREALIARAPGALVSGVSVVQAWTESNGATLSLARADGRIEEATFGAVVGADGKRSVVRESLGIPFDGAYYDGEYAMADAPDTTRLGDAAAVFLTRAGLVESFPLPEGRRRWVVRRGRAQASRDGPTRAEIACIVGERTRAHAEPITLDHTVLDAPSSFRAERRLARALSRGRIVLVGDAAHVVSPIGGQGMNLGWMGARAVAETLADTLGRGRDPASALAHDAAERRALASVAARRAEMNMWLGRPTAGTRIREGVVATLLALPTSHLLARAFTMRGLGFGI